MAKNPFHSKLNIEGLPNYFKIMTEMDKYFEEHGIRFSGTMSPDGYYHKAVRNVLKKGGQEHFKDRDLGNLKIQVYVWLTTGQKVSVHSGKKTLREVFQDAINRENRIKFVDEAKAMKHGKTLYHHTTDFKRFFEHSKLPDMRIDDVTADMLEELGQKNISRYKLRKTAMDKFETISKMIFTEAMRQHLITINVAEDVFWKGLKMATYPAKNLDDRAHTDEQLCLIVEECLKRIEHKPAYIPAYSLIFTILVACRREEFTCVKWSDIEDDTITFQRVQLEPVRGQGKNILDAQLKSRKEGVTRPIAIFPELNDLLIKLRECHDRFYPDSEFLFPANNELGCISLNVTYKLYQRICNNLGIRLSRDAMKGTHSFRRNKATTMSTNGAPATLISDYLGNSPQVLDSNYRLTTRSAKEALKYQETKKYGVSQKMG